MASGTGSIFEYLVSRLPNTAPISFQALITDQATCGAVSVANRYAVPVHVFEAWGPAQKEATCLAISAQLEYWSPDWILALGFMKILNDAFVKRWQAKLINTHPSLLPAFKGAYAVRDAKTFGARVMGSSLHQMIAQVDSGPLVSQLPTLVFESESKEATHERIKTLEKASLVHFLLSRWWGKPS
jgi:phosphoribosylglycinamide formyltransferase-1